MFRFFKRVAPPDTTATPHPFNINLAPGSYAAKLRILSRLERLELAREKFNQQGRDSSDYVDAIEKLRMRLRLGDVTLPYGAAAARKAIEEMEKANASG